MQNKSLYIFLIIPLLISNFSTFAQVKKEESVEDDPISIAQEILSDKRWTETLRLKDFFLLPAFTELKDMLASYQDTLAMNYGQSPDVFSSAVEYGLFLIDVGELNKAKAVWERAANDFNGNPTPKVYRAWVDAAQGNYIKAKDTWLPIAKERLEAGFDSYTLWLPYHIDAVLGLYLIKNNLPKNDKEEIETITKQIANHFVTQPKLSTILITNDLQSGKIKLAAQRIKNVLDKYPNEAHIQTLLAITELINGNYKKTLEILDEAIKINPYLPTNHLMKGRTLLALKRKKESSFEIDEAIKLDSTGNLTKVKKSNLLAQKSYIGSLENKKVKTQVGADHNLPKEVKSKNVPES